MGVTAPRGFVAAGGAAGIKGGDRADLAVVLTEDASAVPAAGVFTQNLAPAAPVQISREHLAQSAGHAVGVVLTSGNANAATGVPGREAALELCRLVGQGIGVPEASILICQTGLIGIPFPIETAAKGVAPIVSMRSGGAEAGRSAATAIMTTDTVRKEALVEGSGFTVGGMAKGAAMLAPNMATMLAVLTTDALCGPEALSGVLGRAVAASFNEMTVDGCCSTNDTVVLLSSGRAGSVAESELEEAVRSACATLADEMVTDAEGGTKVARITVKGAESHTEARSAARQVAGSMLVKCSLNGADPYWGRIVSELGSAGVGFDPDLVSVAYGGIAVCELGIAVGHDAAGVASHLAGDRIEIECDLGLGTGVWSVLTCDLGHGYIDENRTTS
jgi:glutamate N-acetyltransferase/amino-acid N-acetyltransferase